tara:strand:+ start:7010 stop:8344 length:1335 start_codon:yes stop_codon:yes gene_type:complete
MSSKYIEIVPTNVPANGKISFKNGHPVIQFLLGASEHLLLGSSIRLQGDMKCYISPTGGAGSAPDPDAASSADALTMDCFNGIYSTMDQLVIKNVGQFSTIEHIKNYNRFMASYLPISTSSEDALGHFGETALTMPNHTLMKSAVVDWSGDGTSTKRNDFCVHLPCGMFLGQQPIYLGENGINGIVIEVHLAPDADVFFPKDGGVDGSTLTDAFYEFTNLKLTAELIAPDAGQLKQLSSSSGNTYQYNSISSYYTSINSALSVVNFNLGLKNVLGVFANFIEAARINNWNYNGMDTRFLHNSDNSAAYIKNLTFTRGGVKFPDNFDTQTIQKTNADNTTTDPAVIRQFVNAITQYSKQSRTQISPYNTYQNDAAVDTNWTEGRVLGGIGMAYDQVSGQGVDFSNQNWGCQIECNLITDNPTGMYLFVHSKQTLVFNKSGLQILK